MDVWGSLVSGIGEAISRDGSGHWISKRLAASQAKILQADVRDNSPDRPISTLKTFPTPPRTDLGRNELRVPRFATNHSTHLVVRCLGSDRPRRTRIPESLAGQYMLVLGRSSSNARNIDRSRFTPSSRSKVRASAEVACNRERECVTNDLDRNFSKATFRRAFLRDAPPRHTHLTCLTSDELFPLPPLEMRCMANVRLLNTPVGLTDPQSAASNHLLRGEFGMMAPDCTRSYQTAKLKRELACRGVVGGLILAAGWFLLSHPCPGNLAGSLAGWMLGWLAGWLDVIYNILGLIRIMDGPRNHLGQRGSQKRSRIQKSSDL
ncbi:hypothetical protein LSH36_193g02069 [Paralvinella palmiformis]|uniref:Uncharacterized protein n=1 Tax=Paralvinella palmiformis TaxID=53620 RepID=A0AAD9JQH0_9ANNE|nr:hypothetical protein LSH36_193g02069 [Paralvinella palmiformis]